MTYTRFFAMTATSTLVMFGLMYLNTYILSQIFFSETRAYMALVMGATMAIIMLAFMLSMYSSKAVNVAIFAGAAIVFAGALWLVRSQATVGDVSYMRAMIPHHSIAIMTSQRANIEDPRVRKLADEIIAAQEKEIAEMKYLIADLSGGDGAAPSAAPADAPADVATVAQALDRPAIATLDAESLMPAEISRALPDGAVCRFLRTATSPPILGVAADGAGVMKLSGQLVELGAANATDVTTGPVLQTDGLTMTVSPADGAETESVDGARRIAADLRFELAAAEAGLTVGYRGLYECTT